jgi:hypothetical protein
VYLSEALISDGCCNFDSIGIFQKGYGNQGTVVSFEAENMLSSDLLPDLEISTRGLLEYEVRGLKICFPSLLIHLHELLSANIPGIDTTLALYTRTLKEIISALVKEWESDAPVRLQGKELTLEHVGHEWRSVFEPASVFTGYYFFVTSFRRTLWETGLVRVPLIGTFRREKALVRFEASPELLELIDANPKEAAPKEEKAGA